MFKTEFVIDDFKIAMTDIERRHLPFAVAGALNDTMFEVRQRWQEEIPRVFDRPTPIIRNAVLYRKATKDRLVAEVFIRDEASKTSWTPAHTLQPEVEGGERRQKAFERKLQNHPRARKYYVPGKSMPRDQFGNLPRGIYNKVLSQLGVAENVLGFDANETSEARARRLKRERSTRSKRRGGSYFILAKRRGKLRAGVIYERIVTGFGTAVRTVLYPLDRAPVYRPRFNATRFAREVYLDRFPHNFITRMRLAVAGIRIVRG